MKITPLAADSLGARSMATLIETPEVTILIDPSVRLGPYRYDLPPHPTEEAREKELWQGIRSATKKAHGLPAPTAEDMGELRSVVPMNVGIPRAPPIPRDELDGLLADPKVARFLQLLHEAKGA